ncbi:MAG: NUDIX domain-containing protein [Microgenomates group bacterium]
MIIKILIIGVVKKDNSILLRKKPDGSPPYKETWYLFGGELTEQNSPEEAIIAQLKEQTGITIRVLEKIGWDTEVKHDLDGIEKQFIYLNTLCEYVDGDLAAAEGIEKLEWVPIEKLAEYDHVPPSRKLLLELGYIFE